MVVGDITTTVNWANEQSISSRCLCRQSISLDVYTDSLFLLDVYESKENLELSFKVKGVGPCISLT